MRARILLLGLVGLMWCSPGRAKAQPDETLRVMAYNLLNFPDPVPAGRADTFKTIFDASLPDLILVCELKTAAGAESLLSNALNADGGGTYRRADFQSNTSGGSNLQNLAFYNQNKLALYEQAIVRTHVRDINRYTFFFRDPFLAGHNDTTWLDAYMVHFKAGSTVSDENDRARMADSLRAAIDRRGLNRNVVVGGDFNVGTSAEAAYATLDDPFADVWLRDPANRPGSWGSNSTYADVHTQSTRTSSIFGDGSGGGLDDRYDFLLLSSNVFTGSSPVAYAGDSYTAFGNNGNCYNNSIFACSPNPVSRRVRSALYYMSDHLPVLLDLEVTYPEFTALPTSIAAVDVRAWTAEGRLYGESRTGGHWTLFDLTGRLVAHAAVGPGSWSWTADNHLPSGPLLWRWQGADGMQTAKLLPGTHH